MEGMAGAPDRKLYTQPVDAESLWAAGDVDGDGLIGLQDAAALFAGALIPVAAMNTIWGAAAPDGRAIHKDAFPTVLLLIAAAQRGVVPLTVATAAAASPLPPPQFIALSEDDKRKYTAAFQQVTGTLAGQLAPGKVIAMPPTTAAQVFAPWRLPASTLNAIWRLADRDRDNALSLPEFCVAMALVAHAAKGGALPNVVPATLLYKLPAPTHAQMSPVQQQQEQAQAAAPKKALTDSQQRQAAAKLENELAVERKTAKYLEDSIEEEAKKECQLKEQLAQLAIEKQQIQQQIDQAQQQQASRQQTAQAQAEEQSKLSAQLMQLEQQLTEQETSTKAQEAALEKAKNHELALAKEHEKLQTELVKTQKEHEAQPKVSMDDVAAWVASVRQQQIGTVSDDQRRRETAPTNILNEFYAAIAEQQTRVVLDDPLLF